MAELPLVVGGESIESAHQNLVQARIVQRYIDAGSRDAGIPLPVSGDLAWLSATSEFQIYDGATWNTYALVGDSYTKAEADGRFLLLTGGGMSGSITWPEYVGSGSGIGAIDAGAGVGVVLELGEQISGAGSATPFIDWHTGHVGNDHDVRLLASGGVAGVNKGGDLQIQGQDLQLEPRQVSGLGHARSNYGFELTAYNPAPLGFGGDIFGAQTRNVIASDQAPNNANGIDGDVWLQYGA